MICINWSVVHVVAFANSLVQNFFSTATNKNKTFKKNLNNNCISGLAIGKLHTPMACTSRSHNYEDRVQIGMSPSSDFGHRGQGSTSL